MTDTTEPKVFIIESLQFDDEKNQHFEGELISRILKMSGIEHKYYYIRTEKEFRHLLMEFCKVNYRYLHISCHGSENSIGTTLDNILFNRLAGLLANKLDKKRLFLSACSSTNYALADAVFARTQCYSIIGSDNPIYMDDAAIFWASFYQVMFKKNDKMMNQDSIRPTLKQMVKLHKVPIKYFTASVNHNRGWKEVSLS